MTKTKKSFIICGVKEADATGLPEVVHDGALLPPDKTIDSGRS